ncbi:adenylate/guanylate cyclase domain-containing protein [Chachezhania sediminis]|uniref:adenylate/guanylate cyclase domain-containing protein n=1 Tax=Chachezhania sediminis TaxID=2599291 RepID=UPI00131D0735|nr:adenylate/guanylate cyclase domain-containing protein [Chachezhania sediminis]
MTDASRPAFPLFRFLRTERPDAAEIRANAHTEAALERHKREGMELAIRARFVALAVIAVMLPFLNFRWEMLFYEGILALLALNGWLQWRVGRVGRSRAELALIFIDLLLMTATVAVTNPLLQEPWPTAMNFRFGNFVYFFVILAAATLAYSWRTLFAIGAWTAGLWALGVLAVWKWGAVFPELTARAADAFIDHPLVLEILDPNSVDIELRAQEVVVFMIVAFILALTMRRYNNLLMGSAALERERANLSRYFSPNVVEELSHSDEPLKRIQTHNVGVLFVDIVGFSTFAAARHPEEVIGTLRAFLVRMETEVFRHGGTLDKYLGDGLMATFGTPVAGPRDACSALACAEAMIRVTDAWNAERARLGEVPIRASVGVDYGPVVLGDIGANRLEFAVIGNTVNVASRLEKLTRQLNVRIAVSDNLRAQALSEADGDGAVAALCDCGPQEIRGLDRPVRVWAI